MLKTFTAVVENGILRPVLPVALPEGTEVELMVRIPATPEELAAEQAEMERVLAEIREAGAEYSQEWWDDFERELEQNRRPVSSRS